jgi:hypothetical protein
VIRAVRGRAPAADLPLMYLVAAAVAFIVAALAVPWLASELAGHYYHPRVLALTHTVTLGWIALTIMGASYQLIPIVLERPVWSERLARWQLALLVTGTVGMVGHFLIAQWSGLLWSAGLVGLGVAAHLANVALGVRGLRQWSFTARLIAIALAGLALTVTFGLALAADRVRTFLPGAVFPRLHAHFHLALLGWVLPMVVGVAARVYPMFLLTREPDGWPGRLQLWGLGAGVPAVTLGILTHRALLVAGALAVAAAIAGHLAWVLDMVRTRKRPRLDWGLRCALSGAGFLALASALGLGFALDLIAGPRLSLAYAVLALAGWASLTIVGMMLKIVPFLVWYRTYGGHAGRVPVPTLAQLSWPAAEGVAATALTAGALALGVAVAAGHAGWIRATSVLLAAGALAFAAALARVLLHLTARARPLGSAAGVTTAPAEGRSRREGPGERGPTRSATAAP